MLACKVFCHHSQKNMVFFKNLISVSPKVQNICEYFLLFIIFRTTQLKVMSILRKGYLSRQLYHGMELSAIRNVL